MRTRELPSALADRTHLVGEGQPVQAAVKMANAPDLSLRGRFAPMAISPARSGQCRGAACRSRRRTCNLYKPPSKWQTPPTCHCEERSDVAISQYHVGYHESSGENVTAFPRLPRPLWGLAMTRQGGAAMGTVRRTELAVLLPLRGRAGHAPPLQGQYGLNGGRCESAVPSRDCHVASLLAMTRQGSAVVRRYSYSAVSSSCRVSTSSRPGLRRRVKSMAHGLEKTSSLWPR